MIHVAQIEEVTIRVPSMRGSSVWLKLVMSTSDGVSLTAGVGSNNVTMANSPAEVRRALADIHAAADRIERDLDRMHPPVQKLEAVPVELPQGALPAGLPD